CRCLPGTKAIIGTAFCRARFCRTSMILRTALSPRPTKLRIRLTVRCW
ncbi:MAG: hypothetical protein KDB23_23555, partial [Planctomycetales bacterium]|nr:hypothetical protein [Planctomycetales bacterium]